MDRDQMNPTRDQPPNLTSVNPLCYQFMADDALLGMGMQQQQLLPSASIRHMDWSPDTMLDNLTFIEEKIRQVKDVIRAMAGRSSAPPVELAAQQQQQLVNADLTCLIVQLISTAGSLLPSLKNSSFLSRPPPAAGAGPAVSLAGESSSSVRNEVSKVEEMGSPDYEELFKGWTNGAMEECIGGGVLSGGEQDTKVDTGGVDRENPPPPPPESYRVLQLEEDEILAPHTHFCSICGKGFKRDANLRMHMRGHGDEYKSAAALAKPPPSAAAGEEQERRYSCPFAGCKRNQLHRSFQPLKTLLCVKNHYKRSHCEKRHTCSRCGAKKFSVMADLKTHEKHCGRHRWLCSCGTSFSRKDKLFAHVALFQGHTPALPPPPTTTTEVAAAEDPATTARASAPSGHRQEPAGAASFIWGGAASSSCDADAFLDVKGIAGGDDYYSAASLGSMDFGFGQIDAFAGDPSLAMLLPPEQFTSGQEESKEK